MRLNLVPYCFLDKIKLKCNPLQCFPGARVTIRPVNFGKSFLDIPLLLKLVEANIFNKGFKKRIKN